MYLPAFNQFSVRIEYVTLEGKEIEKVGELSTKASTDDQFDLLCVWSVL